MSDFEFNKELYEFLLENEVHMNRVKEKLEFGVFVHFFDIECFIEVVGKWFLDDDGIEVNLNNEYAIYIPLQEIFMYANYSIMEYEACFDEDDIREYKELIEKFDKGES